MTLTASALITRVLTILMDGGAVRWTVPEINDCLNNALNDLAIHRPAAFSDTAVIALAQGTYQELPAGYSQMLRVVRNITSAAGVTPRVSGPIVSPIKRQTLDAQMPSWHDTNSVPFSATVSHVCFDELSPKTFYVFPGNDGTGQLEAVLAADPPVVPQGSNAQDATTYTTTIPLSTIYQGPMIDAMLYYAYAKDMQLAGAAQRAVGHYNKFLAALGVRTQISMTETPNTQGMSAVPNSNQGQ